MGRRARRSAKGKRSELSLGRVTTPKTTSRGNKSLFVCSFSTACLVVAPFPLLEARRWYARQGKA